MKSFTNAAFMGGAIVCASSLAMRLAFAHSLRGVALAVGGAGLELGVLAYLKQKGVALEFKYQEALAKRDAFRRASSLLAVAKAEVERRIKLISDIKEQRDLIEEEQLKGRVFGANPVLARSLAEAAARRGVAEQIAVNRIQNVIPETK